MATSGGGTSSPVSSGLTGSYTLGQLISMWRRRLDDEAEPYLFSNELLTECADRVQKELAAEMPILEGRTEAAVFQIPLVAGDGIVTVSPRITRVVSARLVGETDKLAVVDSALMDRACGPAWAETELVGEVLHLTAEHGTPQYFVLDGFGPGKAVVYPPLEAATATVELYALRAPLLDLDYDAHAAEYLEVDRYAHLLVYGIMYHALTMRDAETGAGKSAEQYRVLWEGQDGHGGDKERIKRLVWKARMASATTEVQDIV